MVDARKITNPKPRYYIWLFTEIVENCITSLNLVPNTLLFAQLTILQIN